MNVLPLVLVDRICLFLRDVHDASALQQTCGRLRWAGLGPECKWHWRLAMARSRALYHSPLRNRILQAGTSVHTLDLAWSRVVCMSVVSNVHTLDVTATPVSDVTELSNVHVLVLSQTAIRDVSPLGNVHALDLSGTPATDVSALERVYNLTLPNSQQTGPWMTDNIMPLHAYSERNFPSHMWPKML